MNTERMPLYNYGPGNMSRMQLCDIKFARESSQWKFSGELEER